MIGNRCRDEMSRKLGPALQGIAVLERRRDEAKHTLEEVRDLLAKADQRRLQEPGNQRKWNQVLDNLESSLKEAKSRLELCEAEFLRAQTLNAAPASEPVAAPSAAPAAADWSRLADEERRLLEVPIEELGNLSLEQLGLLHSRLARRDAAQHPEIEQLFQRIELANQTHHEAAIGPQENPEQHRRQFLLRGAVEKAHKGQIHQMTGEEIQLLISCHALLLRRLNLTNKDRRLIDILGEALTALKRRSTELKQSKKTG